MVRDLRSCLLSFRSKCDKLMHHTDCLKLTKAMQKTTEILQGVADLYDDHVRLCWALTFIGVGSVTDLHIAFVGTENTTRHT